MELLVIIDLHITHPMLELLIFTTANVYPLMCISLRKEQPKCISLAIPKPALTSDDLGILEWVVQKS